MGESIDRHDRDDCVGANTARQSQDQQTNCEDQYNQSNWRRKMALTAVGGAAAGIARAIIDWALHQATS